MPEIYVIHPAYKANALEMWEEWVRKRQVSVGNWLATSKLGDLDTILPSEWAGAEKDKYLEHFRRRRFGATLGGKGEYVARSLWKFYHIPIGSVIIATGARETFGVARVSTKVSYDYTGDAPDGTPDEGYVRSVTGWTKLGVPVNKFSKKVRNKLSNPQTIINLPELLWNDLLTTVEREKGPETRRELENLLNPIT